MVINEDKRRTIKEKINRYIATKICRVPSFLYDYLESRNYQNSDEDDVLIEADEDNDQKV